MIVRNNELVSLLANLLIVKTPRGASRTGGYHGEFLLLLCLWGYSDFPQP